MKDSLSTAPQATSYENVDTVKLASLRKAHSWIVEPIYRASAAVLETLFFPLARCPFSPSAGLREARNCCQLSFLRTSLAMIRAAPSVFRY
jgi:hypothetical protein